MITFHNIRLDIKGRYEKLMLWKLRSRTFPQYTWDAMTSIIREEVDDLHTITTGVHTEGLVYLVTQSTREIRLGMVINRERTWRLFETTANPGDFDWEEIQEYIRKCHDQRKASQGGRSK